MVCTWYNKVLWSPVLNKIAIGGNFGQAADGGQGPKPWGLYAADF
jgi:hypothetical protein